MVNFWRKCPFWLFTRKWGVRKFRQFFLESLETYFLPSKILNQTTKMVWAGHWFKRENVILFDFYTNLTKIEIFIDFLEGVRSKKTSYSESSFRIMKLKKKLVEIGALLENSKIAVFRRANFRNIKGEILQILIFL